MTRPLRLPRRRHDSFSLLPIRPQRSGSALPGVRIAADGTIALPNGQLRAILAIEPVNFDCRSHMEQDALAAQFAALAGALAPGQTLQVLVESRPSNADDILPRVFARLSPRTQALAELVDEEQPWMGRQLVRAHVPDLRYYLSVTAAPERSTIGVRPATQRRSHTEALARRGLEQAVDEVCRHLKRMSIGVRRLSREAALQVLWDGFHPADDPCPPEAEFVIDVQAQRQDQPRQASTPAKRPRKASRQIAAWLEGEHEKLDQEMVDAWWLQRRLCDVHVDETPDSLCIRAGNGRGRFARSLFLLAPPELTDPGWLDPLVGLDCPFRLSLHLEGLDRKAERRRLKRRRRSLNVLTLGATQAGGTADVDMESAQAEARQQALETLDPARTILRMGLYLTVFADDPERLADYAERAYSLLTTRLGAEAGRGIGHQLPLWQATLPLGIDPASRRYRMRSETIGNAFPFLTHNPGMPFGFPLGFTSVGHELVLFDPADPSLPNSLMNVMGRSGSGKTVLAQKLVLQTILQGGRATVIDRAGHYEQLLAVAGGSLARLGAADPPALNLWDHEGDLSAEKVGFVVDAHEIMLARQAGERLDPLVRSILERGVRAIYAHHTGPGMPTERALVAWLLEEADRARDDNRHELLLGLAAKLEPYAQQGRYAALLDRQTSVDLESPLLIFDLDGLSPNLHALVMFMIAESVDRRAKRRRMAEGRAESVRELLVIDEGWFLVKYAAAGSWIEELARRGRHWGLYLVFITQQLSDLVDDPTAATLFNAASVQMLFRQKDQRSVDGEGGLSWLADKLGLSREETDQLGRLSGVRGEYTEMLLLRESKDAATARRGVVQVFCHPLEYWLFTSEPLRDVPYRKRMIEALGGDVWAAVKACAAGEEVPEVPLAAAVAEDEAAGDEASTVDPLPFETPQLELIQMSASTFQHHVGRVTLRVGLLGLLLLCLLGTGLLDAGTTHAAPRRAQAADSGQSGQPTNMPCYYNGVIIGLPTATPSPSPTPAGTPNPSATPTPVPTYGPPYYPPCQFPPAQSSSGCQGWHIPLPFSDGICIAWKQWLTEILQAFAEALGSAAQTAFTWVQGALTYTPDLTTYSDLASLYGSMRDLGSALFVGFFMLAAIRYFLTSLGADSFYEAVGAMRRGIVGAIMLQALDPLLHGWFMAVNSIATAINTTVAGGDIGTFAAEVLGIESLIVGAAGLIAPEVLVAAILLAIVFLILIAAVTVMRLVGLFVLACLYVVAPACLVTWISPEFKGIAKWWFASFVTYSLWGVAYALVLKVDVVLLTTNGGPPNDGTAAGKAVVAALMGLAGLVALWRVPRIMDSLLGGLASTSAGVSVLPSAVMRYVGGYIAR